MKGVAAALSLYVLGCLGCAGDGGIALETCDPLAAREQPIALREVLAAGETSDGTIYVVDRPAGGDDGEEHVFISHGDELRRVRVAGAGSVGTGDRSYSFEVEADPGRLTIAIVIADGETRMAVAPGEDFDRGGGVFNAIVAAGEELDVLDESAIAGMQLRNLPGEIYVEYFAETEDGIEIVVVRPEDDWSYKDFRVFHGLPNRMEEREVIEVLRARDGGTTDIEFVVDGVHYTAHFGVDLATPDGLGPAYLDTNDERIDLMRHDPDRASLRERTFLCLVGNP